MTKDSKPSDAEPRSPDSDVDPEVREVMQDQTRLAAGRGPNIGREARRKRVFASAALKAIKAKDERAFSELLRSVGVKDGSPEWKNAWKAFRSA